MGLKSAIFAQRLLRFKRLCKHWSIALGCDLNYRFDPASRWSMFVDRRLCLNWQNRSSWKCRSHTNKPRRSKTFHSRRKLPWRHQCWVGRSWRWWVDDPGWRELVQRLFQSRYSTCSHCSVFRNQDKICCNLKARIIRTYRYRIPHSKSPLLKLAGAEDWY